MLVLASVVPLALKLLKSKVIEVFSGFDDKANVLQTFWTVAVA